MAVSYYPFVRTQYRLHKITAAQVWEATEGENPKITEEEAALICGPRPATDG